MQIIIVFLISLMLSMGMYYGYYNIDSSQKAYKEKINNQKKRLQLQKDEINSLYKKIYVEQKIYLSEKGAFSPNEELLLAKLQKALTSNNYSSNCEELVSTDFTLDECNEINNKEIGDKFYTTENLHNHNSKALSILKKIYDIKSEQNLSEEEKGDYVSGYLLSIEKLSITDEVIKKQIQQIKDTK